MDFGLWMKGGSLPSSNWLYKSLSKRYIRYNPKCEEVAMGLGENFEQACKLRRQAIESGKKVVGVSTKYRFTFNPDGTWYKEDLKK